MLSVAVIGGGPAGLVTLKHLLAAKDALRSTVTPRLFEADEAIGGAFRSRNYEDGELVSSRQLTTFSDFRWKSGPDFMIVEQYLDYLGAYCEAFRLGPYIDFCCRVTNVRQNDSGRHVVSYTKNGEAREWICDAVAICTGLHVHPSLVPLDGVGNIPKSIHSADFKSSAQFEDAKTVLILGSGETAADVAHLAVTSRSRRVVFCHRDGFHLAPKRNPKPRCTLRLLSSTASDQVPIDISRPSIFDTIYVHPRLRSSNILWTYHDCYLRTILWLSWGTTHGIDQWIGGKPKVFFNKAGHKIAPYIDDYWRPYSIRRVLQYVLKLVFSSEHRSERPSPSAGQIDVAPWPSHVDKDGRVHFQDNHMPEYRRMKNHPRGPVYADMVVFCTGYKPLIPFLDCNAGRRFSEQAPIVESDGEHSEGWNYNPRGLVRGIWPRDDPSLAFVGFARPNLGAIPPLAEMQAQLWITKLLAPSRLSSMRTDDESHYQLHCTQKFPHALRCRSRELRVSACTGYGNGGNPMAYAGDAGRAVETRCYGVSSRSVISGVWYKLPLTWALGANFNTKFRLCGPWAQKEAVTVMAGELWETVTRREVIFGHLTLSAIPIIIFGPLNLILYLITLCLPNGG
ncbi:hypothetical protein PMIN04_011931 [Paraphaeosphaeria minitans]|uniref:Dimethylaniline monooxygenase n=1 Tax=Paraphaeosphaeria minitans TaxID=565426 RepID=A0A9P6G6M9_9PLEO|nr:dimethylaniline monooxygenase [Paraphaeosphaeria minitans]